MFPTAFAYHRAESLADAVSVLQSNPDAKLLAGGHSLIPAMKLRLAAPGTLVDVTRLAELAGVDVSDQEVIVGALTTYDQLRSAEGVAAALPIALEAIHVIGDQQVRARGTIGGALAHNDPAADFTAVFLALGGSVEVTGSGGNRTIQADDLFVDLWTTSLEPDEIITRVTLPVPPAGSHMAYRKHSHPASGYAVVGIAAVVERDGDAVSKASIVVTGATSRPTHLTSVEKGLVGKTLDDATLSSVLATVADGLEINGDTYASAEYRAHLIGVLTRRALTV